MNTKQIAKMCKSWGVTLLMMDDVRPGLLVLTGVFAEDMLKRANLQGYLVEKVDEPTPRLPRSHFSTWVKSYTLLPVQPS